MALWRHVCAWCSCSYIPIKILQMSFTHHMYSCLIFHSTYMKPFTWTCVSLLSSITSACWIYLTICLDPARIPALVNTFSLFSQLSCGPCLFRFSSSLSNISLSTLGNIGMSFTCLPILGLCMLILTHLSPLLMHSMHWLILEVTLYCGVYSNSNVLPYKGS